MSYRASACAVVSAGLFSLCAGAAVAAEPDGSFQARVAVVNIERVLTSSAPAQEANRKIRLEFLPREQLIDHKAVELRQMTARYEKELPQLSDRDRVLRSRELDEFERDLNRQRSQFREDLAERQSRARAEVAARVYEAIKSLPREQQVDLVLIKSIWHSARVDVTDKILQMLEH
jgi:Skp family chaperone for outer membrane proteins